jgi:hypothetical protein
MRCCSPVRQVEDRHGPQSGQRDARPVRIVAEAHPGAEHSRGRGPGRVAARQAREWVLGLSVPRQPVLRPVRRPQGPELALRPVSRLLRRDGVRSTRLLPFRSDGALRPAPGRGHHAPRGGASVSHRTDPARAAEAPSLRAGKPASPILVREPPERGHQRLPACAICASRRSPASTGHG